MTLKVTSRDQDKFGALQEIESGQGTVEVAKGHSPYTW